LGIVREKFLVGIEESVKSAKGEWAGLKKIGAVGAGSEGVEEAWGKVCFTVFVLPYASLSCELW